MLFKMNLKELMWREKKSENLKLSVSPREVISFRYETLDYRVEQ